MKIGNPNLPGPRGVHICGPVAMLRILLLHGIIAEYDCATRTTLARLMRAFLLSPVR